MDYSPPTSPQPAGLFPKRKPPHLTGTAQEQSQPWTATRCHRLLRPLLAHLGALKKEKARRSGVSESTDDIDGPSNRSPGKRRGRAGSKQTTYSRKTSTRATSPTPEEPRRQRVGRRPVQENAVPISYLGHTTNDYVESSPARPIVFARAPTETSGVYDRAGSARCVHRGCNIEAGRCMLESSMRTFREELDRDMFSICESILRALDALLRATCPPESQPSGSSKSFLAMCLRKIPDYIADLEYWEKKDAEVNKTKSVIQDSKVSFDIYSELESLGALGGWKHLRIVVRAHGLKIIQGAIRDGLIEDRVVTTVIGLCMMYLPFVESMELINTFVSRQYPPPDPFVRDGLTLKAPGLHPLWAFGLDNAKPKRFMIGKLADLFADGSLPAEWLLINASKTICFNAIVKLAYGPGQDCVDFLVTMVNVLSPLMVEGRRKKRPAPTSCSSTDIESPERAQRVLAEYMGLLVTLVIPQSYDHDTAMAEMAQSDRSTLSHRVRYIFRTYLLHVGKTAGRPSLGVYLISLCDFLAFGTKSSASIFTSAWIEARNSQNSRRSSQQYSITLAVLATMVRWFCAGVAMSSAHTYITRVCKMIEPLWTLGNLSCQPFENLEVDLAFEVALKTNDLQDLAYAEKLWEEKKSTAHPLVTRKVQPCQEAREGSEGNSLAGFKWDDALSEWVTIESPGLSMGEIEGGRRTTRSSTGRLPTMGAIQRYLPTPAATPATVAFASTSMPVPNNKEPTRGSSTRLLRSGSTSTSTLATVHNTDSNTDEKDDEDDDASSETSNTSQTDNDDAGVASNSDWNSDFKTSNVGGRNVTRPHQQIQPRPRTHLLYKQRRLAGKRKPSHLAREDEEGGQKESSDHDNANDDSGNFTRRPLPQTKRLRTRASSASSTIAVSANASASGRRSGGISRRRSSLRRSTGSSTGNGRAIIDRDEETSEDELG
ncbi:hypothetical protein B0T20DRAFT_108332 [Sordaria brevicollis]|uniref:Uncharacterized protein n=1 Tax=Sordaria brevicollis TaxID=83679 RepID=A0AAE0NV31_SORBR|nr:hypothetical protein B0T20DRAFT_108332 [Sordaria brevicollis]